MIISRTPFRISFFGGGTDYPEWFEKNKGATISTSIDKYCYINLRTLPPYFNYKYRFRYFEREEVNDINQIKHPSIKNCLDFLGFKKIRQGLEVVHNADVPALSGLGSSSTFTVGMLHALHCYKKKMVKKERLMQEAIHVERNLIGESVGYQDQMAAAYGGLNYTEYKRNKNIKPKRIFLSDFEKNKLERNSVLLFTGQKRIADVIAKDQVKNIKNDKSYNQLESINRITQQTMTEIFLSKKIDYKKFGLALTESWEFKKQLSNKITNDQIDNIFSLAKEYGAYGGKLLGAGAGGFVLFLFPANKKQAFIKKNPKLLHVPFKLESMGSQIIYNSMNY